MSSACIEVAEAILLFMGLQYDHLSRTSLKQLKPQLSISIASGEPEGSAKTLYRIRVAASGLGAYYLDGETFLNKLCQCGEKVRHMLIAATGNEEQPPLRLLCRRIGDYTDVQSYEVQGLQTDTGLPILREAVVPRPEDFPVAGLCIAFQVNLAEEALLTEASKLSAQLHLVHLVNPEVHLSLSVKSSRAVRSVEYDKEPYKPISNSPFKMITALRHYMDPDSIPPRQSKLYLLRGHPYQIPSFTLKEGRPVSLKLYCSVAVVPHLPLRNGRKIPANRLCNTLHPKVSVFGPASLPLLPAGSPANFPLTSLAEWENYGMSVEHRAVDEPPAGLATVVPSFSCGVGNSRSGRERVQSAVGGGRSLELFVFLEDASPAGSRRGPDNDQWRQSIELVHGLRRSFDQFVVSNAKKFQQASHSALNKLICNYGSHLKASSVMSTAIPLISEAIASIVKHSSSERFKKECTDLVKAESEADVELCVKRRLWQLAKDKLKLHHPSDTTLYVPDEPPTPEIIQAASEAGRTKTKPQKKKRNESTASGESQQQSQPEGGSGDSKDGSELAQDSQRCSEDVHIPLSQSLFVARITSKRRIGGDEVPQRSGQPSGDDPSCTRPGQVSGHCSSTASHHDSQEVPQAGNEHTEEVLTNTVDTSLDEETADECFDALMEVDEPVKEDYTSLTEEPEHQLDGPDSAEECSEPLLGPCQPRPPTPTQLQVAPTPPDTCDTNSGFEALETIDMEEDLGTMLSLGPVWDSALTNVTPPRGEENQEADLECLRDDDMLESETESLSGFDQLECFSENEGSFEESDFTDCELDLSCFSNEDNEMTADEDVPAALPGVKPATNSTGCHNDLSGSEWNELDFDSPAAPTGRPLPPNSLHSKQCDIPSEDSFECLDQVELLTEAELTPSEKGGTLTVSEDGQGDIRPLASIPTASSSNRTRDFDDISDHDLDWEDGEANSIASISMLPSITPGLAQEHKCGSKGEMSHTPPRQTSPTAQVPDTELENYWTCEVEEEDFHWD